MDIVLMSTETIKPSSPTPKHLRNLNFSLIDQYQIRNSYTSVLLFYSAQGDACRFEQTKMSDRLKKSLSETLTEFYPIAGRIDNNEWIIDCNDDGLEYVEARVSGPLSHVLGCPKPDELTQLIPNIKHLLSAIQVSVFQCGGMAIGVSVSHETGDASSLAMFINSWAAIARGARETVPPKFGFESLFPPAVDVPSLSVAAVMEGMSLQRYVTKRFVFDSSKLEALKAICANVVKSPTRVEVVTALIFKCFITAAKWRSSKPSVVSMPVNLRARMSPPLPKHCFGNLAIRVTSPPWPTEREPELDCLVGQLRDIIRKIDGDYVEKLQADNARLLSRQFKEIRDNSMKGGINTLYILCCCRFPFYEADFGWGIPTWVTRLLVQAPNVNILDTMSGGGIEAWVTLDEEDMERFCSEQDLLDFACENPMIHE